MQGGKLRVFLDSNVIFSALYSPDGAPGRILNLFISGEVIIIVSPQVLDEVMRTINEKIPAALPALRRLLLNSPQEITADPQPSAINLWKQKLAVGDAAILAAAIAAQPDYFITGDHHFLTHPDITNQAGLRVITPAQFMKSLQQ